MRKHISSISKVKFYKGIGEFWDTHDLGEFWNQTKKASFEVDIESEVTYYSVDKRLAPWNSELKGIIIGVGELRTL
jgi:hypothetical protein